MLLRTTQRLLQSNTTKTTQAPTPDVAAVTGWACGGSPPALLEENPEDVPLCLVVESISAIHPERLPSRPLCLSSTEDASMPLAWCYDFDGDAYSFSYHLWWSPCDKCGTAWRLFHTRMDDESWYKLPEPSQPGSFEFPSGESDWLEWNGDHWSDSIELNIRPCSDQEYSICFLDVPAEPSLPTPVDNPSTLDLPLPPSYDDYEGGEYWEYESGSSSSGSSSSGGGPMIMLWVFLPAVVLGVVSTLICGSKGRGGGGGRQGMQGHNDGVHHHHHAVAMGGL